ncbi:MAG: hypothetical protein R3Y13_00090 [bacterium]
MKKIFFLFVVLFCLTINTYALDVTQGFSDVYLTFDNGTDTEIYPINTIKNSNTYYYKLHLGEVASNGYNLTDTDFLKTGADAVLSNYIYHGYEINETNSIKWYYVVQYFIYDYLYGSDYNIYFSDEYGVATNYLSDELTEFNALLKERAYDNGTFYIHNNETIDIKSNILSVNSNLQINNVDDGILVRFLNGTTGKIFLTEVFNASQDSQIYMNGYNNILYAGGAEFNEYENITVVLDNLASYDTENPATGDNPFIYIYYGIPIIVLITIMCLIYNNFYKTKYSEKDFY